MVLCETLVIVRVLVGRVWALREFQGQKML